MPLVQQAGRLSYHTPCHDSLRGEGVTLLKRLIADVSRQPHCCSEAGTLSLSRPDITRAMLQRKAAVFANTANCAPNDTL